MHQMHRVGYFRLIFSLQNNCTVLVVEFETIYNKWKITSEADLDSANLSLLLVQLNAGPLIIARCSLPASSIPQRELEFQRTITLDRFNVVVIVELGDGWEVIGF